MRTMQVKGIGNVTQSPDTIELSLTLITENMDYEQMMATANANLDTLRDDLFAVGFKRDALKTTNFNVENKYENEKSSNGEYERVFMGYQSTHNLLLTFPYDTDQLSRTLYALSNSKTVPEFTIAFTIQDKNAVTARLLENAMADATNKAEILAKSANITLGEIQSIVYDYPEMRPYSNTRFQPRMALSSTFDSTAMNINPEDIRSNNNVTVTWNISDQS